MMHAYGTLAAAAVYPTLGRMRERKAESAEAWSYHHRPSEVGDIIFDTTTMTPSPSCSPQGTWTATARHGQATLHQHLRARH